MIEEEDCRSEQMYFPIIYFKLHIQKTYFPRVNPPPEEQHIGRELERNINKFEYLASQPRTFEITFVYIYYDPAVASFVAKKIINCDYKNRKGQYSDTQMQRCGENGGLKCWKEVVRARKPADRFHLESLRYNEIDWHFFIVYFY